ncbi:MAG: M28 family peptidase, partial [Opitutales bacterium]
MKLLSRLLPYGLALLLSHASGADVVRTKGGSTLTGRIEQIDEGTLTLETIFAGTLSIKLDEVAGFSTDGEAFLRLADGSEPRGRVQDRPGQSLLVEGAVPAATPKTAVRQLWRAADEDPALAAERTAAEALRKKWHATISFDLTGSSGNAEDFGLASQIKAAYGNERVITKFHFSHHNSRRSDETTTDETKAGADHTSFFSERTGW